MVHAFVISVRFESMILCVYGYMCCCVCVTMQDKHFCSAPLEKNVSKASDSCHLLLLCVSGISPLWGTGG